MGTSLAHNNYLPSWLAQLVAFQLAFRSLQVRFQGTAHSFTSCQLMGKECRLNTSNLPLGGLHRNSVVRITDHADITSAVHCGR